MNEWTDPRYASLVKAWKRTQQPTSRDREPQPRRGFIIPSKG